MVGNGVLFWLHSIKGTGRIETKSLIMNVKNVVTLCEVADDLQDGKAFYEQREIGNYHLIKKESGFTLLEIIFSLVILSIIVAIAGLGIVTGTKGYLFARQNAHSAQKAQMALARITREFQELYTITACPGTYASFESNAGKFTIGLSGNTIRITTGGINQLAAGDILRGFYNGQG